MSASVSLVATIGGPVLFLICSFPLVTPVGVTGQPDRLPNHQMTGGMLALHMKFASSYFEFSSQNPMQQPKQSESG
jgi:hypothetical protein